MYASQVNYIKGVQTGRLLRYDPLTDEMKVLARDLFFANGIGVDKDEKYLVFAETFSLRLGKYYLSGEKEGTIDYIVKGSPSPACKTITKTRIFVSIVPLMTRPCFHCLRF